MSRRVEVKIALQIVRPSIDLLRNHVADLEINRCAQATETNGEVDTNYDDVQILLALFNSDFDNTGAIKVDQQFCPAVLRACSFVRLRLRQAELAAIPDATLEYAFDPTSYVGKEKDALMLFAFLATLQEVLLTELGLSQRSLEFGAWIGVFSRVKRLVSGKERSQGAKISSKPGQTDTWQVVVLNDPVNLMSYVTAVLHSVVSLPENLAEKCMREVHERKSSTVWIGSHDKAEIHARTLRSWHLQVVVRKNEPAVGGL